MFPTAAIPGTPFSVTGVVNNPTPVTAGASSLRYYLSSDVAKDAGDVLLGARSVAALTAGTSSSGSTTMTIPAATALGTYYVIACADDALQVRGDRRDEQLSYVEYPDPVDAPGPPDGVGEQSACGGHAWHDVHDHRPGAESEPRDRRSVDAAVLPVGGCLKGAGDILLTGSRSVPALAAGATSAGTTTVTVPAASVLGTYYVLACADDTLVVGEIDEANNCLASGSTVLLARPDLVLATMNNPPTGAAPGTTFAVTAAVQNPSPVTAPASTLRYYMSANALKDGADVLLTGNRSVPALLAGATSSGSTTVTVPATTALGTYYVLACADDKLVVNEADEANNCIAVRCHGYRGASRSRAGDDQQSARGRGARHDVRGHGRGAEPKPGDRPGLDVALLPLDQRAQGRSGHAADRLPAPSLRWWRARHPAAIQPSRCRRRPSWEPISCSHARTTRWWSTKRTKRTTAAPRGPRLSSRVPTSSWQR